MAKNLVTGGFINFIVAHLDNWEIFIMRGQHVLGFISVDDDFI